jgi:D-3-phosphoglycerate dehydrogenase / 2-oxoglutarate reductase
MYKVLVSDSVSQECVNILEANENIEVTFNTKLTPEEFNDIIGDYDGLVVRSATKVREDSIKLAKKLKIIGRAGAGVDNIDVAKATDAGIIVSNTPGGNTVSTAEHAFSLMMALSRNVAQGDRSLREGRWDRKKYMGVELRGKTIGVIGLGNIGQVLVQRAKAFGMKAIGYDPFLSAELAESLGIESVSLDEIWAQADYISLHTPLNDSTRHLINAETLAKCKDGLRIINCARGGIVDEKAALDALESGKLAGVALDVYEEEPPVNNPLVMHEKVVSTPHLGASTSEAQDIVAVMVAEQVRDFLVSGEVKHAVNMPSMPPDVYEQIKPFMTLGSKMGAFLGQIGGGQLKEIDITFYGDIHNFDTWAITSSILEGLFTRSLSEGVNLINAKKTAENLGIKVREIKSSDEKDYKNCIETCLFTSETQVDLLGTNFGKKDARIVEFNGYKIDFVPEGDMLICGNKDRPGIIGDLGTALGAKGINIGHMTWARQSALGDAIVVLNTDEKVGDDAIADVENIKDIKWAKSIEM